MQRLVLPAPFGLSTRFPKIVLEMRNAAHTCIPMNAIEFDLAADGLQLRAGIVVETEKDDTPPEWQSDPIGFAVRALEEHGVEIAVDPFTAPGAILVAEAVNWAAKVICGSFYDFKPAVWAAVAAMDGVEGGWADDGTYAISHPAVGVAHAHMLWDMPPGQWPHPWSGVRRQSWAFRLLKSARARRLMAWLTEPLEERRLWFAELCKRRNARRMSADIRATGQMQEAVVA